MNKHLRRNCLWKHKSIGTKTLKQEAEKSNIEKFHISWHFGAQPSKTMWTFHLNSLDSVKLELVLFNNTFQAYALFGDVKAFHTTLRIEL